jgi:hypothetical protein
MSFIVQPTGQNLSNKDMYLSHRLPLKDSRLGYLQATGGGKIEILPLNLMAAENK